MKYLATDTDLGVIYFRLRPWGQGPVLEIRMLMAGDTVVVSLGKALRNLPEQYIFENFKATRSVTAVYFYNFFRCEPV